MFVLWDGRMYKEWSWEEREGGRERGKEGDMQEGREDKRERVRRSRERERARKGGRERERRRRGGPPLYWYGCLWPTRNYICGLVVAAKSCRTCYMTSSTACVYKKLL